MTVVHALLLRSSQGGHLDARDWLRIFVKPCRRDSWRGREMCVRHVLGSHDGLG